MKRKFSSTIAIITIIVTICSVITPIYAEDEYIKGFKKVNTYTPGQFVDVDDEWYADSIHSVYEVGLMKGSSDNLFEPNGNLTIAEAVTIAARLHSIHTTGTENFIQSTPWYKTYIEYAVSNNFCDDLFSPDEIVDRAFFAVILNKAVNVSAFPVKNNIADETLWDVNGWYSEAVYNMYRAGILCGNDKYGTFAPDTSITRGEVAAIIMRIIVPSYRQSVNIAQKAGYTIDAPVDGNSFENFKQRAIVANLKWILSDEDQGPEWQNDIYTIHHEEIPGDYIHVNRRDIEFSYDISDFTNIHIPNRYLNKPGDGYTLVGDWSLYVGFRSFLSGYTGSMPDGKYGDLYLSKPKVDAYTDTYTYSTYTQEVRNMIDAAYIEPTLTDEEINAFVSANLGDTEDYIYKIIGKLVFWENNYYIQSDPEYRFSVKINDVNYNNWLKEHQDKYVIGIFTSDCASMPYLLATIKGYAPEERNYTVKSWEYFGWNNSNKLAVKWNSNFRFENPIKLNLNAISQIKANEKEAYITNIKNTDFGGFNSLKDKINEIILNVSDVDSPAIYEESNFDEEFDFYLTKNIPNIHASKDSGRNVKMDAYTDRGYGSRTLAPNLNPANNKKYGGTYTVFGFTPIWNKVGFPEDANLDELDYENTTLKLFDDGDKFSKYLKIKEWDSSFGDVYQIPIYYTIVFIDFGDAQFYVGLI